MKQYFPGVKLPYWLPCPKAQSCNSGLHLLTLPSECADTELDWVAYMQEVEGYMQASRHTTTCALTIWLSF